MENSICFNKFGTGIGTVKCKYIERYMSKNNILYRIYVFYRDGFRSMTLGRTLWLIILLKLFIMFVILKIFFFPNILGKFDSDVEKGEYVKEQLINLKDN